MGQQKNRSPWRRACQRFLEIGAFVAVVLRSSIGNACHGQLGASVPNDGVLVRQHVNAESLQRVLPRRVVKVILVIARNAYRPVPSDKPGQRLDVFLSSCGAAINKIASDDDKVSIEGIGAVDDTLHPVALKQLADVQVTQLDQLEPFQFGR